jgi:hypothetical protein
MFSRFVSLGLVAAIIACPLWCGSGMCQAGCCSPGQPSQTDRRDAEPVCECCAEADNDNSSREQRRHPGESPSKSCQGVCGGAVFEKPLALNAPSASVVRLPIADASQDAWRPVDATCIVARHSLHHFGGKNLGRALRTLHMSFLC